MLDDYGFELYEENEFPLAYLLTFRTFGTWLHGDVGWSVGRTRKGPRERKFIQPNKPLEEAMRAEMRQEPIILTPPQRASVEEAVKEVCRNRGYGFHAVNVRTNHGHAVITAQMKPEPIVNALKAYATRKLRQNKLIDPCLEVWSRGRSRRYLWKPRNVFAAVDYTLYCQGWVPFEDWVVDWEAGTVACPSKTNVWA